MVGDGGPTAYEQRVAKSSLEVKATEAHMEDGWPKVDLNENIAISGCGTALAVRTAPAIRVEHRTHGLPLLLNTHAQLSLPRRSRRLDSLIL